jgi:nucleoside-diphosphate-sugar epimerase
MPQEIVRLDTMNREHRRIADPDDLILITGSNGFIGTHVVLALLSMGFTNLRCLVRSSMHRTEALRRVIDRFPDAKVELVEGNLRSRRDADTAARGARLVFHLAAGIEKSFAGCVMNTVVATRNLLEAVSQSNLKRFVNISSFAVYSNFGLKRSAVLDETCPLEQHHVERNEPYSYAKAKQDELVVQYAKTYNMPYVILRPGAVYGPGKAEISGRVGIGTFGIFMQLGKRNRIPFTYVANCAEAIVLAGVTEGADGHVFNVVDDDLPTGRMFMKGYTKHVIGMRYVSVPYPVFYAFSYFWERYVRWSEGQLPLAFNRRRCAAYWKGNRYSNAKLKQLVGWTPRVSFEEGARAYFEDARKRRMASC